MVSTQATTKTRIVYIWLRRPTKPEGIVTVTSVRSRSLLLVACFGWRGGDRLDFEKKKWFHLVSILGNGGNKERNMVYRLTLTVLGDFIDGVLIVIYFCQASSFSVSLAFVRRTTTTTTTC